MEIGGKEIGDERVRSGTVLTDTMKRFYDRHRLDAPSWSPGDLVWLDATNIPSPRPTRKLDDRRIGPYIVDRKVGSSSYRLHLPGSAGRRHATFHQDLLRPYRPPAFPSQTAPPPPSPDLIAGHEEWEIDFLKDSRFRRRQLQYLVHWHGFDDSEDSWEPASQLRHARSVIRDFHRLHPSRPRPARLP